MLSVIFLRDIFFSISKLIQMSAIR